MAGEKKELNKGFPNGLLLFVLAAVLLVLTVQNFMETKIAKVSFSYQLEHLVNLQLIEPDDSRKIALNDNLVGWGSKHSQELN